MDRKEIQARLVQLGVNETLTKMPAVIEPIYRVLESRKESGLELKKIVEVDNDGNLIFYDELENADYSKKKISLHADGSAIIRFAPYEIDISPEGIEYRLRKFCDAITYNQEILREPDGKIKLKSASRSWEYYCDNGNFDIRNALGEKIYSFSDKLKEPGDIIDCFKSNMSLVTSYYPETQSWYQTRLLSVDMLAHQEFDFEVQFERLRQYNTMLNQTNASLKSEKNNLIQRNRVLEKALSNATTMLRATLECIDSVKESPICRMAFRTELLKVENSSRSLEINPGNSEVKSK